MAGLHEAFVDELRDAYDAEKQLLKALPKLAKAASAAALKNALLDHLDETRGHVEALEQVFASIDQRARGKHCDGIAGIIEEGRSIMEEDFDADTMDASLIAAAQRSEHYEIAAYGTLTAWAKALGHSEATSLLETILEEERAADEKLTALAGGGINERAADSAIPDDDGEEVEGGGLLASVKRVVTAGGRSGGARPATARKSARSPRVSKPVKKKARR